MTKLGTYTVAAGGTITEVVFDNIPQGYTDLKVLVSARDGSTSGIGNGLLGIKLNNDVSPTQGSHLILYGTGSSLASTKYLNTQYVWVGFLPNTSNTSSTFSNIEVNVSDYSGNQIKVWSADCTTENDATAAYSSFVSGAWNNSSPITMLTMYDYGGAYFFAQHSTFTLYGIKNAAKTAGNSIKATGGNIVFDGTYVYHVFNASGAFVPTQGLTADALVVAGGGGGGSVVAGGGGAGGLLGFTNQTFSSGVTYTCTVGTGGAGGVYTSGSYGSGNYGTNGNDSQLGALTLVKGGGGGAPNDRAGFTQGLAGGSGGGGASSTSTNGTGGAATSGQGQNGGASASDNNTYRYTGGGGGAGNTGSPDATASRGGIGGVGSSAYSSWGAATGQGQNVSGTYYFAGGGGAGQTVQAGGYGGGASGGTNAGSINTGGGGGGSSGVNAGGAGGSGIVIIRYKG
jgi:hypothetical protein